MNKDQTKANHNNLFEGINTLFNDVEIKELCFKLKVDYDSLEGETKSNKVISLITYHERRGEINNLLELCIKDRPNFKWKTNDFPLSSTDPKVKDFFIALENKIEKAKKEKFTFLLMGRTGVGKTSTVRSLLGEDIGIVKDWEPATMDVAIYDAKISNIQFRIIDTPGLCDELEEERNDDKYIKQIKEKIKEFDCLWFVSRLNETRVTADEKRGIKGITEAFGSEVWKHAIIIFTFANAITGESEYKNALQIRTKLIRQEIQKRTGEAIASDIPSVAVDNMVTTTPDKRKWLGELYTTVFERISDRGLWPFVVATTNSISYGGSSSYISNRKSNSSDIGNNLNASPKIEINMITKPSRPEYNLSPEQLGRVENRIHSSITASTVTGAAVGAAIGSLAGPVGTVLGAAVGAIFGFIKAQNQNKK